MLYVIMRTNAIYIYLAVGCGMMGVVMTFVVIFMCHYFNVDIAKNLWVITIPIIFSIFLNILLIELYFKYRKK